MEAIIAYRCWAVYADYDSYAPDTADLILCETEELATKIADFLNDAGDQTYAFVSTSEGFKAYRTHKTVIEDSTVILTSYEEFVVTYIDIDENLGDVREASTK